VGVNGVNQQLSTMMDRFAYVRTGIVTNIDPFGATVTVGSTSIRAAYVRQSEPDIGDVVVVIRQGATWFILGTSSASGPNLVQNPSFEDTNEDGTPTMWVQTAVLCTPIFSSVPDPVAAEGSHVLEVFCPDICVSAVSLVQSAPIAVTVGQMLEVSAYVNGYYPSDNANTTDVVLQMVWFANSTDIYPITSSADSTIVTINNITEETTMRSIRGTVTVPVGAVFGRVGLRTTAATSTGSHWDFVGVRVVS
jgi:hypothetical protein